MSCAMESNRLTIIVINARSYYDRSSEISAYIFNCNIRSAEIRFGSDIKAIGMVFINFIFNRNERLTNGISKVFKKNFAECVSQEGIIEMLHRAPNDRVSSATFRNKSMNVRIPF